MGALVAWVSPALADSTTTTGSLTASGFLTSSPQSGSSMCPAGDVVQGFNTFIYPVQNFAGGAQVICADANGTVTLGDIIGNSQESDIATSTCPAGTVGVGIYGNAGAVVNGFGLRCSTSVSNPVTNTDGSYLGDPGGSPQGPFDCPAGSRLTGLEGTGADYFGGVDLVTLTGVCSPALQYKVNGFLPPVQNPPLVNHGQSGRTYPLKWQLLGANGQYVSSLSAVESVTATSASCSTGTPGATDPLTARGAGLSYDPTSNQYVFNWATPGPGCYQVVVTLNNGQMLTALFDLS